MAKSLSTTKSDLIRRSVLYYRDVLEKEKPKEQIESASFKARKTL